MARLLLVSCTMKKVGLSKVASAPDSFQVLCRTEEAMQEAVVAPRASLARAWLGRACAPELISRLTVAEWDP